MSPGVHRKKRPSQVRVKVTPSHRGIKKHVRLLQDSSSHSSQDSVNVTLPARVLADDRTSLDDSVIEDSVIEDSVIEDSVIEDDDISEIIALLESARSRSRNFVENEGVLEQASKASKARTKRKPEKYY